MRLPPLPPTSLTATQKDLYADMRAVIDSGFGELVAYRGDEALIGPFNGWLHFPQFGSPAWAFNRSLWEHGLLAGGIHQLVILVTVARFGARYAIYGHEYFARRAGLSEEKIATIASGERPGDLTDDERVAYDMSAALNRGGALPETTTVPPFDTSASTGQPKSSFWWVVSPWSPSPSTHSTPAYRGARKRSRSPQNKTCAR